MDGINIASILNLTRYTQILKFQEVININHYRSKIIYIVGEHTFSVD